jgi:predicted O-linked N-acetylglucosamine transferase (SPINDLY family)
MGKRGFLSRLAATIVRPVDPAQPHARSVPSMPSSSVGDDLHFFDTLPYNAHTTANNALWSEVPVVTCLGSTFAGRVCASLLTAVGLLELIVF